MFSCNATEQLGLSAMKQRLYAMMDICCRESLDHDAFQQEDGPTLYPLVDDVSLDVLGFYCVKPI